MSTSGHRRQSTGLGILLGSVALFGVVLTTYLLNQPVAPANNDSTTVKQATAQEDVLVEQVTEPVAAPQAAPTEPLMVASLEPADTPFAVNDIKQVVTPDTQIEDHLAAGEFGLAMEVAVNAGDKAALKKIADAQHAAGEFDAARFIIGRMSANDRSDYLKKNAGGRSMAGGVGVADFTELIDLITQNTAGPWLDIDGIGGTIGSYSNGVHVDPNGRLTTLAKVDQTDRLRNLGFAARDAKLNEDMQQPSTLRVVSLTRLENAVSDKMFLGESIPETMRQLAGLTAIQYVIVDEATGELLVAGPAEGWQYDATGRPRGSQSGNPTLQLDDFVTVMRTFAPGAMREFQCLIVPRQENLASVRDYVEQSQSRGPLAAGAGTRNFVNRIEQLLGEQDVEVNGIATNSRVAQVIVEADYRMKLIGIDKLDEGGIPSYFDLVDPKAAAVPMQALRWWLTVGYDAVLHSPEQNVFEFVGSAVRCQSEDEFIAKDGSRIHTGKSEGPNRVFAQKFTNMYEALAAEDPVFADLKNIFDLALAAAIIDRNGLDSRVNWDRGVFGVGGAYQPLTYAPAKTVPSAVNHRVYNGKDVVVQAAGGVEGDLNRVLDDESVVRVADRLSGMTNVTENAPATRWWWDAK
ncbi:DUF1598 domain-containing protein [Calycomorphotria hydatis]|uniref:DUF1598 domain-containing protein n=1 Tax=Calycomorphotria hydatis TaxID=2528027 RepID=A0A517T467_9PLAN|nr:DUF1598 domain-containing protein [Calycomorphotria hydatis]QDT63159.1 hypothetical protein V22_03770 [Calycomorphotria hydatis]